MKIKCPVCHHELSDESKYCKYCGNALNNIPTEDMSAKKCKVCGAILKPEDMYCTHCGSRISSAESTAVSIKTKPKHTIGRFILTSLAVISILFLCFSAFLFLHFGDYLRDLLPGFSSSDESEYSEGTDSSKEETGILSSNSQIEVEAPDNDSTTINPQANNEIEVVNNQSTNEPVVNNDDVTADEVEAATPSAADMGMKIPSDALVLNGHSYYLYDNDCKDWDAVLDFCESKGGYPAVINDSEENESLYEYMLSMGRKATLIGYTDRDTEGIWRWVDGKYSDFTDWGTNNEGELEPNSDSSDEDYAQFDINMLDGHWNYCAFAWDTASFICEWDSIN